MDCPPGDWDEKVFAIGSQCNRKRDGRHGTGLLYSPKLNVDVRKEGPLLCQ